MTKLTPTMLITSLIIAFSLFTRCSSLKEGETCFSDHDQCDSGLQCGTCTTPARCIRVQPHNPLSKVTRLPYNKYTWLMTHTSFARMGHRSDTRAVNQEDSVTAQLENGVRGLMLDMYDFENDIWLCHSFHGKCFNYTAFQPAVNVLKEVQAFLAANPTEIITIIIEDYVTTQSGLTKIFKAAGLKSFLFPVSRMPSNGHNWPTVKSMIEHNQRLVVFTSNSSKEASEGIGYTWRYLVENQYGSDGMKNGSCPNRVESSPMNTTSRSLVLLNHFTNSPDFIDVCKHNSAQLMNQLKICYVAAGKRWPNFIAVDFYKRSEGGGAPAATDLANGKRVCGCNNIDTCKNKMIFGDCYNLVGKLKNLFYMLTIVQLLKLFILSVQKFIVNLRFEETRRHLQMLDELDELVAEAQRQLRDIRQRQYRDIRNRHED